MSSDHFRGLIDGYRPGYGLPSGFYADPDVWQADIELMAPLWHLVGHESQLPHAGDTKILNMFGDSHVLVRGDDGVVRGFDNVCPHRGARLCEADESRLRRFTCPYHAWSFGLDGSLKSALHQASFGDDFDPEEHGLRAHHVRTFHGLIFLSFSDTPTDFEAAVEPFDAMFELYGIADAKVAHVEGSRVRANWKTLVENTLDQYHVPVVHTNFPKNRPAAFWRADGITSQAGGNGLEATRAYERDVEEWRSNLKYGPELTGLLLEDGADNEQFRFMVRGPLSPGHLSETIGGKLVAPFMGKFAESDGASAFSNVNPLDSVFMSPDHVVFFNIIPVARDEICWQTTWLVDKNAEEGTDYDVEEVVEFYRDVNAEDLPIWEATYAGTTSRGYRPGRYTPQEGLIASFVTWYIGHLREHVVAPE